MAVLNRLRRMLSLIGLSLRRTYIRATHTAPGRTWFSVGGVALAVGLMVVVTGIGVGIATQATVYSEDVDYWITPETDGGSSALVSTDTPQLGSVHSVTKDLTEQESIQYASPVLTQPIRMKTTKGKATNVLAVGIIKYPQFDRISAVTTAGLTPNDPYYFRGQWTGEVVLSSGAAKLLSASEGDKLEIVRPSKGSKRSFSVATIGSGKQKGSQFPVAVMHLSELQAITGADKNDEAGQIVVSSTNPEIRSMLANIYPRSEVSTRAGLNARAVLEKKLPLALSVTAAIISVVIGTLFVMTTTGLSVAADRETLATLAAIGISKQTRFRLFAIEILAITFLGGIIGVGLGRGAISLTNIIAQQTIARGIVASTEPIVLAFGILIASVIGLLALPYLAFLLSRIGNAVEVTR